MPSAPARAADASSRSLQIKGGRKWFGRVLRRRETAPALATATATNVVVSDGLDAFAEEGSPSVPSALPSSPAPARSTVIAIPGRILDEPRAIGIGVAVVVVALAALGLYRFGAPWQRLRTPEIPQGKLTINTVPAGAEVLIDGRPSGLTPLSLDVAAGAHAVVLRSEGGTIERRVVVEAGGTTSVVFSTPKAAGPASGWLSVSAPFDVQIFEGQDLVGISSTARIMLTTGRHEFRLVNQNLGYEDTRRIDIAAGKQTAVKVDPPKATLSANAKPWADVIIDGVNVGQTPLANLSLAIGQHQVIFRHPQLGERRQTTLVTAKGPNRISADMTKP